MATLPKWLPPPLLLLLRRTGCGLAGGCWLADEIDRSALKRRLLLLPMNVGGGGASADACGSVRSTLVGMFGAIRSRMARRALLQGGREGRVGERRRDGREQTSIGWARGVAYMGRTHESECRRAMGQAVDDHVSRQPDRDLVAHTV